MINAHSVFFHRPEGWLRLLHHDRLSHHHWLTGIDWRNCDHRHGLQPLHDELFSVGVDHDEPVDVD